MKLYTLSKLARVVGLSAKTLYRRRDDGYLTGQKLGKTTFYTTADFERALRRSSEGLIKLKQDGTRGKYIAEKKGKKTTEFILTKQFIKEQYK